MSAENGMPENEDVKNKAILRLAVAGVVTVAALGGLWWLDQSSGEAKKPPAAVTPAPIVSAPKTDAPVPEAETPVELPDTTEPEGAAAETPEEAEADQAELPPPPRVRNNLGGMPSGPAPIQQAAPKLPPKPTATPLPVTKPALQSSPPPTPTPQPMPTAGKSFVVQLGVFNNPENARELVNKLKKQGIRAHLDARVQIGPFLNREEAEKAQLEMRKLGYNALVTLPYSAQPATQ